MANKLEGKVAIITGAGSPAGIGKEVALAMAAEGAKVVVNDIYKDPNGGYGADRVVKMIKDAGGTAAANYDSVASMEGGQNIVKTAVDNFGRVDILVNTAGNFKIVPTIELTEKDWDSIIAVHVKGMFSCTQAALKVMIPQKSGGRIINFTSLAAYPPGIGPGASIAYCAAKAAVIGFTRNTAQGAGGRAGAARHYRQRDIPGSYNNALPRKASQRTTRTGLHRTHSRFLG